jgi:hypothetical protein
VKFTNLHLASILRRSGRAPILIEGKSFEILARAQAVLCDEPRTVFCSKHLGENVKRVMEHASRTLGAFWALIHRKIQGDTFVQILKAESERFTKGSPQAHMLGFLKANLEHFSSV